MEKEIKHISSRLGFMYMGETHQQLRE